MGKENLLQEISKQVNGLAQIKKKEININHKNQNSTKEKMVILTIRIPEQWKQSIKQQLRKEGIEEISVAIRKILVKEFSLE